MKKLYYALVGFRSRRDYWAHSKFVKSIRARLGAEVAPNAATAREWREFHERNDGTFVNWLTDDFVDLIQDTVMFVPDVYANFSSKIRNRFFDRPWCLDTKLNKWEWHESDTRIVHGLFETLVDFVEHEKAALQYWAESREKEQKVKRKFPSRKKGLAYLDWEISLGERSPHQSESAREIKELYLWWKDVRPTRPDPMDESGWSAYCDERRKACGEKSFWCQLDIEDQTEEERDESLNMINRSHEIEQQQHDEDTEMMIRLIKIRERLWT